MSNYNNITSGYNSNGLQTFTLKLSDGTTQTITGFDNFKKFMDGTRNPVNNTPTQSQNIFSNLKLNPTKPNTMNSVHVGDQSILKFNGKLDPIMEKKLTESGFKTFKDGNGNIYAMKEDSFMQKYGSGIQTGLAAGGLALGVANYIDSHAAMKKQKALMEEQTEALKDNREHLKSEWARVNKIRKNLNSSY